jgi:hypothetical protein
MLSLVTKDNILLWQSDSPDVIFNCRRISLFFDTNVIYMPVVNDYNPSDSEIILFRKIAEYIEYVSRQCIKAVTDYKSLPFNSFISEILKDNMLFEQCQASSKYNEEKLRNHLTFLNDCIKIKKSWTIGFYLRYVDRLINVTTDTELNLIKIDFELEFDRCNRV